MLRMYQGAQTKPCTTLLTAEEASWWLGCVRLIYHTASGENKQFWWQSRAFLIEEPSDLPGQ